MRTTRAARREALKEFWRDTAKQVKESTNLRDLAKDFGIEQRQRMWRCCFHEEATPSMSISPKGFKCFGCAAKGDAIRFVMLYLRLGFIDAVRHLADRAGIRIPEATESRRTPGNRCPLKPRPEPTPEDREIARAAHNRRVEILTAFAKRHLLTPSFSATCGYLAGRGISHETATASGVARVMNYKQAGEFLKGMATVAELQAAGLFNERGNLITFRHTLLFPFWLDGECLGLQARNMAWQVKSDGAKELTLGPVTIPFNADALCEPHEQLYITEGAIDCLSLLELGLPAVGLPGVGNFKASWVPMFDQADEVVLALDNDPAGRESTPIIARHFAKHGRTVRVLNWPAGCKDANEYFCSLAAKEGGVA